MASITLDSSVLIIGAGTWGCSVALELARRRYTNVTVLDGHSFPSAIAAGNDLNKIMEEATPKPEDSDREYFFNRVSQLSGQAWREDPIYSSFYHQTGFIMSACSASFYKEHVLPYAKEFPDTVLLESAEQWRATMPEGVLTGDFPGWRGVYRRTGAGWVFARGAIEAVLAEAVRLGVKLIANSSEGAVTSLLFSDDLTNVRGATTADGRTHYADTTILAAGANSDLLLDFKKQLRPTAWTLAHVPLSPSEARIYKDMPVPYNIERGFFIEPDAETHQIKICDEHPGYVHMVTDSKTGEERSVPFAKHQIPVASEARIRRLLRDTMPQLSEREFSFARICWDADTADRIFLIDRHPEYSSLVLACGGSGHGVNPMPAIGKIVVDRLEGTMEERLRKMARWRPEQVVNRDWWDLQGRHGADEKIMEFGDVEKWTRIGEGRSEKL
ncbi:hypothetical protein LTR36_001724 [Oleoguttula mirabilis]|uniref:FAD dependent oxidoreductase domain-containing protein n=1 Tax=Oleoguttula mirabilis TaxID=1507867 RepID=A0AAV9JMC0_9PEZI|nr:hypothetical protein LTR36_001724 [Oleoguttula mirabilis]